MSLARAVKSILLPAIAVALLAGCATKSSYVVLLPDPDGKVGAVVVKGKEGEQVITKAGEGAPLDGSKPAAPVDPAKIKEDFAVVMAARPPLAAHYQLYFESGGVALTAESSALLPKILSEARNRAAADVSIIGHSDTVGPADINQALALTRAQSIADMLATQGLSALAIKVESHGESNLLVKTPDETPEPRNRRVEITIR